MTPVAPSGNSPAAAAGHPGLARLIEIMDRLRRDAAWEAGATHASLAEYLLEETYELLEAIDSGDRGHLREELGDVLLQVVFHCRIAMDDPQDPFDIDDVADGIADKLVRRSPHVFDPLRPAPDPASTWESVKAGEKGRSSPLEGLPAALPPLVAIAKIRHRAKLAAAEYALWPPGRAPGADAEEAFGDELLRQALQAAQEGIDVERAMRGAVRRSRSRVVLAAATGAAPVAADIRCGG